MKQQLLSFFSPSILHTNINHKWHCIRQPIRLLMCSVGGPKIGRGPRTQDSGMDARKQNERGDKESPKVCTRLKSCESLYTCPRAPFYKETKGLLHFEIVLESREYSWCEHVLYVLYIP
jgi:hypothetical protein